MVTELADFLGVTASTMSLNLKRLQEAGVVRRSRDPADRRVVNVLLTGEGERLRTLATPYDPHRIAAVLERLRPEDRRRALDGLALLADAADAVSAAGRSYVEALAGGDGAGES
jgi:DNA-binding MarR family transcriptional regulator